VVQGTVSRRKKDDWDEDSSNPGHRKYERRASSSDHHLAAQPRGLWARLRGFFSRLFLGKQQPLLPRARRSWDEHRALLSKSTLDDLDALPAELTPEVAEILRDAVEDFVHLRELVDSGGLQATSVDGPVLLVEAEAALQDVVERSLPVATLTSLAERRKDDANAESAGVLALESIRKEAQVLHEATSAAILYAASLSEDDASALSEHADKLHLLVEAHKELDQDLLES
jgi:hypothetical protein